MAGRAIESESDLDLAFRLQLEEALNASLYFHPSSSSSPPPNHQHPLPDHPDNDVCILTGIQKFEQQVDDKTLKDLDRRMHDHLVARKIQLMPDEEWEEEGGLFERPFGEGSSHNGTSTNIFRVYFKGLMSEESVTNSSSNSSSIPVGIGVAICDSADQLIFELKKPLNVSGISKRAVEFKALIEGLNAAIALDLKRIVFYCDYYPLYQLVTRKWRLPKQQKMAALVTQVFHLQNKFTYCKPTLVARNDIKFAFKFAREAMTSSLLPSSSSSSQIEKVNCVICFEDTNITDIFAVDSCNHRYCFSCMRQHVEMKLRIGMTPECPHEGCNSKLEIESCQKFLTPKLTELMRQRLKEASIPASEKIYCPYPKCSNLMRKSELQDYSIAVSFFRFAKKCLKCKELFCIECKVPWHTGMNCNQYKMKVGTNQGDAKLKNLAARNLWRQCVKCNHMIELAAGCYHMTCRCGYEFCYTCGAEWKNKKATCGCPLWIEENILEDDEDEDEDEDEEIEEEFDEDDYPFLDNDYESYYDSDADVVWYD
jgi:hypothetical protein